MDKVKENLVILANTVGQELVRVAATIPRNDGTRDNYGCVRPDIRHYQQVQALHNTLLTAIQQVP